MRIVLLLVGLCLPAGVFCQDLLFIGEDLTFRLSLDYLSVDGTYIFFNPTDRPMERMIYYPVGGDGSYDSVRIFDLGRNRVVEPASPGPHGWSIMVHADARDTSIVYIRYRQRVTADSAVYLLQTTHRWGRPLETAVYTLITGDCFPAVSCSYPPDTLYRVEGSTIYRWRKKEFFPEKDMIFHFKIP